MTHALASAAVRLFYRVTRIGPPVPVGPALLVANHPNALLDPAAVWVTAGRPVRFLAKSTLFLTPIIGWIVRLSGGIPVYRRMDAGEDVTRNAEMFAACQTALAAGDAICLFPEGTTHSAGRLAQLRTGAARIALAAADAGVPVAIVPVGLDFERKATFRSRALIAYAEPFRCDQLLGQYRMDPHAAIRTLTATVAERLRLVMIEAEPRHDAELVARVDRLYTAARGASRDPQRRFRRRQLIAAGIDQLRANDAPTYERLLTRLRQYDEILDRLGLRERALDYDPDATDIARFAVRESMLALVVLPLSVAGGLVFAVPYLLTDLVARLVHDLEVRATWKVVGGAAFYVGWIVLVALLAGRTFGATAAAAAIVVLPLVGMATLWAMEHLGTTSRIVATYLDSLRIPAAIKHRLARQRGELADVLEQTAEWLEREGQPLTPNP